MKRTRQQRRRSRKHFYQNLIDLCRQYAMEKVLIPGERIYGAGYEQLTLAMETLTEPAPGLPPRHRLLKAAIALKLLTLDQVPQGWRTFVKPKRPPKDQKVRFYKSAQWHKLRYRVLQIHGRKCQCCGTDQGKICVDHIKSISKHWDLRFDIRNLQVLCDSCNQGKGGKDETDWRPKAFLYICNVEGRRKRVLSAYESTFSHPGM